MKTSIAIGALVLAACAGSASAALVNGAMGFAPFGGSGSFVGTPGQLANATSFSFFSGLHIMNNNGGSASFGGSPNIFDVPLSPFKIVTIGSPTITLPGGVVPLAPAVTLNNNYASVFTIALGDGSNIRFSSTSQSFYSGTANSMVITFFGTASDLNNVHTGVANAAMTMSFVPQGGNLLNYSVSFAAAIPAPGAVALLGMGGLLAARRRR